MSSEVIERIVRTLEDAYPDAKVALHFNNPIECLVATILSAQCTDKRVNIVTTELFKKYPLVKDYAQANLEEFEQDIRSTGSFRNKAKNIIAAAQMIMEDHGGKVPQTMEELVALPGVARKTANIVLSNSFGIVVGMAVDTHIKRLSFRLGFTKNTNPVKVEVDLMHVLPKEKWFPLSYVLIDHGRAICNAKKPLCSKCPVEALCPKNGVTVSV